MRLSLLLIALAFFVHCEAGRGGAGGYGGGSPGMPGLPGGDDFDGAPGLPGLPGGVGVDSFIQDDWIRALLRKYLAEETRLNGKKKGALSSLYYPSDVYPYYFPMYYPHYYGSGGAGGGYGGGRGGAPGMPGEPGY